MDLKKDDKIIGNMYINLQLKISQLPESPAKILSKAKKGELSINLKDNVSCLIESYRKHYSSEEYLFFEGVNLKF